MAKQRELLESTADACARNGIEFTWVFDGTGHALDITTYSSCKIVLDRGLDIFHAPLRKVGLSLADGLQDHRTIKRSYATYVGTTGHGQQAL